MRSSNKKAFTIVELVIVIAVIAILAAVMIPTFSSLIKSATKSADESELVAINTQLATNKVTTGEQLYALIASTYPEKAADFAPKSAKYGYSFFYDVQENKVILSTYSNLEKPAPTDSDDLKSPEEGKAPYGMITLGGDPAKGNTEFLAAEENAFRMQHGRYYWLDLSGVIGDVLVAVDNVDAAISDGASAEKINEALDVLNDKFGTLKDAAGAKLNTAYEEFVAVVGEMEKVCADRLNKATKVEGFSVKADVGTSTEEAIYVPYDEKNFTLTAYNFEFSQEDYEAGVTVTWNDPNNEYVTIDGEGNVTHDFPFGEDYEGDYEFEIGVTVARADGGGAFTRTIKICLVVVTDMDVTINNQLVNFLVDEPFIKITYDGTGDATYGFVVDNFQTNYDGYSVDTTVRYEYDKTRLTIKDDKLTLKEDENGDIIVGETVVTIKVGPEDSPYLEETVTVVIATNYFKSNLQYVNVFTYRVGNLNSVTLGTLFNPARVPSNFVVRIKDQGQAVGGVAPIIGSNPAFNATVGGESKDNATWVIDGTTDAWKDIAIQFSGVGVAIIEIDGVDALTLEVVNAYNYFEDQTLPAAANTNIVLLGNVRVRTAAEIGTETATQLRASALSMNNKCLFGNGFEIDATNTTNTALGVISLSNGAMLDNAIVIGAVYTTYQGNSGNGDAWSTSLVYSTYGSIISNSYLANTKAPVRVGTGTTTIINSTISGGCYANVDVRTGSELILENVTLINQVGDKTPANNALGLGVAVYHDAKAARVVIKGTLNQYNAVSVDSDMDYLPNGAEKVEEYIDQIKSIDPFDVGGKTYNDTGIIFLSGDVGDFVDFTEAADSVKNTHANKNVASGRYLYHITTAAGPDLYDGSYSYDNTWEQNGYVPTAQGDIPPTYATVLTTTKQGEDDYCYLDGSTIKIGFADGGSETVTFSTGVFNITDSLGNKLDLKSIKIDGAEVEDTHTFTQGGSYTLKVTVEANEKEYTYQLAVNVAISSYKPAVISLTSNSKNSSAAKYWDYTVELHILNGIRIQDKDVDITISDNKLPAGWTIALEGYKVIITTNILNSSGVNTRLEISVSATGTGAGTWKLSNNKLLSTDKKKKGVATSPTATYTYYGYNGEASNQVTFTHNWS